LQPDPSNIELKKGAALDIEVGANVLVEPYGNPGLRFKSEFVGMERGRFFAVRLPLQNKYFEALPIRRPLTIRFLQDGGQICGFESAVIHLMVKPFSLLFMDYPITIEILNLRRHDRVNCFFPVLVYHDNGESRGVVLNISGGGGRITIETENQKGLKNIAQGSEIFCQMRIFDSAEEVYVKGVVKFKLTKGAKITLGVSFDDMSEEVREGIERYIQNVRKFLE